MNVLKRFLTYSRVAYLVHHLALDPQVAVGALHPETRLTRPIDPLDWQCLCLWGVAGMVLCLRFDPVPEGPGHGLSIQETMAEENMAAVDNQGVQFRQTFLLSLSKFAYRVHKTYTFCISQYHDDSSYLADLYIKEWDRYQQVQWMMKSKRLMAHGRVEAAKWATILQMIQGHY